jgi:PAS domain S-box-containing protein
MAEGSDRRGAGVDEAYEPSTLHAHAIVAVDRAGIVRLFSAGAERITGRTVNDVVGRAFVELVGSASRGVVQELLDDSDGGCAEVVQTRTTRGCVHELSWELVRLPGDEPTGVLMFAFGKDLSEERAQAQTARAVERLATFASLGTGLAHEIRNPLNGALLHVTLLERAFAKHGIEGECKDALQVIESEIQRLSRLVTEFLEVARPARPHLAPASTRIIAEHLGKRMAARVARAGVKLSTDVEDVAFAGDAAKIERALDHLLANAIEASGPGQRVTLRAHRADRTLVFEVEDEGSGIADAALAVFEPFVSTKPGGTGLGLAIVHRIAGDLGGSVRFDSRPGRTVFTLALPLGSGAPK